MDEIPDFADTELATLQAQVDRRWGAGAIELQLADIELTLDPSKPHLTTCPAVVWTAGDCGFVVHKLGERRYRCRFFYPDLEQFGTGIEEYDDLSACVVTLLQIQADHESVRTGAYPGQGTE